MHIFLLNAAGLPVHLVRYGDETNGPWLAVDRLAVTDETAAAIQRCTWEGTMPDIRALRDASGAPIYTMADVRAHRDLLLHRTDWCKGSTSTNPAVAATIAARQGLFTLPDTITDPTTAVFPKLSDWSADCFSPSLIAS
jgi:hypothetical protein